MRSVGDGSDDELGGLVRSPDAVGNHQRQHQFRLDSIDTHTTLEDHGSTSARTASSPILYSDPSPRRTRPQNAIAIALFATSPMSTLTSLSSTKYATSP